MHIKKLLQVLFFMAITAMNAQEWQTNLETAKTMAKQEDKNIVLVFQGSDWCAPCIKLDREIWSTIDFKNLAKEEFVMLQADFPRRKQNKLPKGLEAHNAALAEKYNPNGYFPFVVVLNGEGEVLGTAGYEKISPQEYFNKLNSFSL